jgi:hypothetical protein
LNIAKDAATSAVSWMSSSFAPAARAAATSSAVTSRPDRCTLPAIARRARILSVTGAVSGSSIQAFVRANPITHVTTAARSLMHGDIDAGAVGWAAVWSALVFAVFAPSPCGSTPVSGSSGTGGRS